MLLDAVPEEFLRRAVSHEHMFLRQVYTENTADRRCAVIFDAGVDQLGASRIMHLALLIVLAQRAEVSRAGLSWCVLQDPEFRTHDTVTQVNVRQLMRSGSTSGVTSDVLDRCVRTMRESPSVELWLIGSEAFTRHAGQLNASAVTISDVFERESLGKLHLRVTALRAQVKDMLVDVPEKHLAVQLLRDPFALATPVRTRIPEVDITSNLVLSDDGRKIYVRGQGTSLIAFTIPNSPRANQGKPVAFTAPDDQVILGIAQRRKCVAVLTQGGAELFVHELSKRGAVSLACRRYVLDASLAAGFSSQAELCSFIWLRDFEQSDKPEDRFWYVNESLIELVDGKACLRTKLDAVCWKVCMGKVAWLTLDGTLILTLTAPEHELRSAHARTLPYPAKDFETCCFGGGTDIFSFKTGPGSWAGLAMNHGFTFEIDDRYRFVRAVGAYAKPEEICFVAYDPVESKLVSITKDHVDVIARTTTPIVSLETSTSHVAFMTQAGEVFVYSRLWKSIVLRGAP